MTPLLIQAIQLIANVLVILVIARVLVSWIAPSGPNQLVYWVHRLTEPWMGPVRQFIPSFGGIDFSPIIVLLGIQVLEQVLIRLLIQIG